MNQIDDRWRKNRNNFYAYLFYVFLSLSVADVCVCVCVEVVGATIEIIFFRGKSKQCELFMQFCNRTLQKWSFTNGIRNTLARHLKPIATTRQLCVFPNAPCIFH